MMLQVACKNGRVISLGIWDTAGAERFEALSRMYYNGAKAAVLAFDPCNAKSFEKLKFWVCICDKCVCCNSQSPVLAQGLCLFLSACSARTALAMKHLYCCEWQAAYVLCNALEL